ncbi:hypothetical protein [Rhodoglobus aureus]
MNRKFRAKNYLSLPFTTTVAIAGMVAGAGLIVIDFAQLMVSAATEPGAAAVIVVLVITLAITVAMPVFAAIGLKRGSRWASTLVTVFAVWSCVLLFWYRDPLGLLSAFVSFVSLVAVWTPSARNFARDARSQGSSGL